KIKSANFAYSSVDEMGLALKYAQSLFKNKYEDQAVKLAENIFNQPNIQANYKSAALKILAEKDSNKYKNTLFAGVQDGSALYRNTSLSLINENWKSNAKLIGLIPKS